ncbi:hypothetical protein C0J52_12051 [Blattella germanica]|nr:hypothetical protein C0J52_12051 [Blattella germanica]
MKNWNFCNRQADTNYCSYSPVHSNCSAREVLFYQAKWTLSSLKFWVPTLGDKHETWLIAANSFLVFYSIQNGQNVMRLLYTVENWKQQRRIATGEDIDNAVCQQMTRFTHGAENSEADGIQRFPHRWQRVVAVSGDYFGAEIPGASFWIHFQDDHHNHHHHHHRRLHKYIFNIKK